MREVIVEMANPQAVILREIQEYKLPQKDVALTYAFCIRQANEVDFRIVNYAIVERWSISAVERVKRMAWKHSESKSEADDRIEDETNKHRFA